MERLLQQLNQLPPEIAYGALALFLLGLLASFLLGRRGGRGAGRVRELEGTVSELRESSEKLTEELEGYRKRVADHFIESSEKLHELTLQYRSVYDHLAQGAAELCPEQLQEGMRPLSLSDATSPDPEPEAAPETGTTAEAAQEAPHTAPDVPEGERIELKVETNAGPRAGEPRPKEA